MSRRIYYPRPTLLASFFLFGLIPDAPGQTNFTAIKRMALATGVVPIGRITAGSDGVLYATTAGGGLSNAGVVFRVNADGSGFASIKSFTGADGANPYAGVAVTNGNLFGTTYSGGLSNFGTYLQSPPSFAASKTAVAMANIPTRSCCKRRMVIFMAELIVVGRGAARFSK